MIYLIFSVHFCYSFYADVRLRNKGIKISKRYSCCRRCTVFAINYFFPTVYPFQFYEDVNVYEGKSDLSLPFRSCCTTKRRAQESEAEKRRKKKRKARVNVLATPCLKDCK